MEKFSTFKKYFLYFLMYSVIGWAYEVFLEVVVYRWGFSDRGVLTGPYCPVYGVGAIIFLLAIYPLINKKPLKKRLCMLPLVFLLCALSATAVELAASYICELCTGSWPWQTYADYTYNFQARIALSPSIRFGIGGAVFLYILQPLFERMMNKLGKKGVNTVFIVCGVLFLADLLYFVIKTAL